MLIAVNTRLLLKDKMDGIGWFAFETLKRITQNHPEHQFIFLFDRKFSEEFIFSQNIITKIFPPPTRHPLLLRTWLELSLPRFLGKSKPDLFLSPDGFIPLSTSVKMLPVMHDLNFIHYPEKLKGGWGKYFHSHFIKAAAKATRIATVSEFSKQDIAKQFGVDATKIDVVYDGASDIYNPISAEEKTKVKGQYTVGEDYFLFVGSLYKRKNVRNLLLAFEQFKASSPSKMKLLIVGRRIWWSEEIEEAHNKMKFKDDVIFVGHLPLKELSQVTAAAYALAYVSLFEGFGIPIVEAMQCDVPIITSNVTSMPEVAGDAAILVDPHSVDSIASAMSSIAKDDTMRLSLIEKGKRQRLNFSWDKSASLLWESIERTANA